MGKLTQYRNTYTIEEIETDIHSLIPIQLDNFNFFIDVITKSDQKNPAFLHSTDSYEEIMKFGEICNLIGR